MRKSFLIVLLAWIASILIGVILAEVFMGSLGPRQPQWAKTVEQFLEASGLGIFALILMYLAVIVTWLGPLVLIAIALSPPNAAPPEDDARSAESRDKEHHAGT